MKRRSSLLYPLLGGALLALAVAPSPSSGQANKEEPITAAEVTEMVNQQAQLIANQTKIDEQVAFIAEEVRQARLFAARGGNKK